MRNTQIIFNGESSSDHGIIVTEYPRTTHPSRRGEAYSILGRNGTEYAEDGSFDNCERVYNIAFPEYRRPAVSVCNDIAAWLLSSHGCCRLEDSFEPEHFRLARYAGPLDIEQILGKWGKASLSFDCRPERFLKSGEKEVDAFDALSIFNPTRFESKPLLIVTSTGNFTMTVLHGGETQVEISFTHGAGALYIDSEDCSIRDNTGAELTNVANWLDGAMADYNEFPVLMPGVTEFEFSSAVVGFSIIPRWYTI